MRVLLPRGRRVLPNGLRGERPQGLLQDPEDRPGTEAVQGSSSSSSSSSSLSFASSAAGTVPCLRTKKADTRNRQHAKKALPCHLSLELEDLYLLYLLCSKLEKLHTLFLCKPWFHLSGEVSRRLR